MKILDPGHRYDLLSFDGNAKCELQFVKRIGDGYPGNVGPAYSGTNCQEVIRALIDRVNYLNEQIQHPQNASIIRGLRVALLAFEVRAAERHGRELVSKSPIENEPSCATCGHIGCEHLLSTQKVEQNHIEKLYVENLAGMNLRPARGTALTPQGGSGV